MVEDNKYIIKGLPPSGPIPDISVGRLIYDELIVNSSDNAALVDAFTEEFITYKQILTKTCSLAESLKRSGYNEKSMISICSENCNEFFIPIIAAFYIGATVAPINHNYTEPELIHALNIAKPQIIFCSKQIYSKILGVKKRLSFIEKIIIIDSRELTTDPETIDSFTKRSLNTTDCLYRFDVVDVPSDHVALVLYSSGTTGLPKGVMITHRNIIVKFIHSSDHRLFPQEKGRCTLGLLPFFHAYGLFVGLGAIHKTVKVIVIKRFDDKVFLSCIQNYKITGLPLVPPLAIFLAKSPLVNSYDLSSIKHVGCGAAPLSKETEQLLKKRLKVDKIVQGYGLTESTLSLTGLPLDVERNGSSGKVFPYMLCKVRDPETGKSLGPKQVGELCFKGPLIMKGYYGNEEATRNSFTSDGWLLTGDLGYYDEDEYFFIVGRLKELIKYKGFQVPPAELESVLLTNPKIKDAGVIGVPDEEAGELPLAFIVKSPDADLTEEDVQSFVAERVSSPKRLRGGVIFISEIPKNPSGKILRKKLHELLNRYYKAKL